MKVVNKNIKTFNDWAINDKDFNMQKGHTPAVNEMIKTITTQTNIMKSNYNFLDLGCGNGWVVRQIAKDNFCKLAVGIDGAEAMIKKAKRLQTNKEKFIYDDIEKCAIKEKFDIIFSMETFYYFKNPGKIMNSLYNESLNPNGFFIIGIDHFLENKESLNWDEEYNLFTNTLSKNEWNFLFKNAGLKNVKSKLFGKKDNWGGTLIIYGQKL